MTTTAWSAPVTAKPASAPDAMTALASLLRSDLAACNQTIVTHMASEITLIPTVGAHIVAAGGKRLRPLLTMACARLCGYGEAAGEQRHVQMAACVEFIHTATLLHDDVVDESQLRRGLASATAIFDNKASVLVGDFLFARAFRLMVADGSLRVLAILSDASATIAEGEVLQLATQNDLSTPESRYLEVIRGKTAALFAAACEVGAVIADRSDAQAAALAEYGMNLGLAFQLVDDALDYAADQATLGKTVGDDFRRLRRHRGDQGPRRRLCRTREGRVGDLPRFGLSQRAVRGGGFRGQPEQVTPARGLAGRVPRSGRARRQ